MPRFIEQFYYGNIEPQERSTKMNKSVQKKLEIMMKCEELLTEALTDEKKQWFLDYVDAWHEVNSESNLDSFIMGFRLGAGFAYDTFVSTDAPFTDFSGGDEYGKEDKINTQRPRVQNRYQCNKQYAKQAYTRGTLY